MQMMRFRAKRIWMAIGNRHDAELCHLALTPRAFLVLTPFQ